MNVNRMMRIQRKIEGDVGRWQRLLGLDGMSDGRPKRRVGVPDLGMSDDVGIPPPSVFDTASSSAGGGGGMPIPTSIDFTGGS